VVELTKERIDVRLGYQANSWGGVVGHPVGVTSIKDLFYLTPGDPWQALDDIAAAGFEGVELFDGNLVEHVDRLPEELEQRGLSLLGVYSGANLVFPEVLGEELWRVRRACEAAQRVGAEHLVIGGGAQRTEAATDADYDRLGAALDEVARIAAGHGLIASYHPHLTTIAESPEQIERALSRSEIGFCPDTGHLIAGGGDPAQLIRRWHDRIPLVHLKDVTADGAFVPLGHGVMDVAEVCDALLGIGFDGWVGVELDGWDGDPAEGARINFGVLQEALVARL
jgi:inosose dehydratase